MPLRIVGHDNSMYLMTYYQIKNQNGEETSKQEQLANCTIGEP